MVSIRKAKQGFQLRKHGRRTFFQAHLNKEFRLVAGGLAVGVFLIMVFQSLGLRGDGESVVGVVAGGGGLPANLRNRHPHPHLSMNSAPMGERYDAIAQNILDALNCANLFNETINSYNNGIDNLDDGRIDERRRRLQEWSNNDPHGDDGGFLDPPPGGVSDVGDDAQLDEEGDNMGDDMSGFDGEGGYSYMTITAKHLFCVAAYEQHAPKDITDNMKCDAAGARRQTLLDLWSSAMSQFASIQLLSQVLDLAREQQQQMLFDRMYHLWAPDEDNGLSFMLNTLNNEENMENKVLRGLEENLGPGKLFVDVGSCLGITTLAITQLYPGTKIVSIEPAKPNWLLQELNLRCNLSEEEFHRTHLVLAGVGPNTEYEDNLMGKVMWRPTATTSTRAWSPGEEHTADDIELVLNLRRLPSILAECNAHDQPIDVLNVDCEGCEYNLIPSLTAEEFEAIPTVMGDLHWGYIPPQKLPSTKRARTTHKRLCQHENIAKSAKECCSVPDVAVKSSVPGEVLQRVSENNNVIEPHQRGATVADVAGSLCDDYDAWASEHYLNVFIEDDFGWFELTSQA